jgi:hypothetical protein
MKMAANNFKRIISNFTIQTMFAIDPSRPRQRRPE